MRRTLLSVKALVVSCGVAHAQMSLGPEVLVSGPRTDTPQSRDSETAIAVSPVNPSRLIVAWNRIVGGIPTIWYTLSNDGGQSFAPARPLPMPTCGEPYLSDDPMVAASRNPSSPDLFAGGVMYNTVVGAGHPMFIDRFANGVGPVSSASAPSACPGSPIYDKGCLAVGSAPGGAPGETMYAMALDVSNLFTEFMVCNPSAPLGTRWPATGTPILGASGLGAFAAVTRHSSVQAPSGRVIMALGDEGGVPNIYHSDDGGHHWTAAAPFLRDSEGNPILDSEDVPLPPGVHANGFASIALDPFDTTHVYVAFAAASAADPGRVGIFIAESTDGGATFANANGATISRIRGARLSFPGERSTHQLMPSIAVDDSGGLNLLFAWTDSGVNAPPGTARVSMRLANWPPAVPRSNTPRLLDLTGFFTVYGSVNIGGYLNDYQMVTTAGCWLWAAYSRSDPTEQQHVYVRRVSLTENCAPFELADFNGDGAVDAADAAAYAGAYLQGAAEARLHAGEGVDATDLLLFQRAYSTARREGGRP